jgi:hypothetical protein
MNRYFTLSQWRGPLLHPQLVTWTVTSSSVSDVGNYVTLSDMDRYFILSDMDRYFNLS